MNNPLISIIVPVYNGETYLARCLDSLLDQTYAPIEILVVNDGSQDRTAEILSQYEQYPQIKVFYQENKGLSGARNLGLKHFEGDFVCFVDSDDYVTPTYCEELYKALIDNNADISVCQYTLIDTKGKEIPQVNDKKVQLFSHIEALALLLEDGQLKSYAWGKLFKKELLENFSFPMGRIFEDYASMFFLFDKATKVVMINNCLYNYIQYPNSLSNKKGGEKFFHITRFYLFSKEVEKSIEQVMKERLTSFYSNEYKKIPFKYRWKIFSFLKLPFLYNTYIQFKKR